jgi:cytochrome c oxidase assembly protein subunit 15
MAHLRAAHSATAHILQQVRLLHPLIALVAGTLVVSASAPWLRRDPIRQTHRWGRAALAFAVVQAAAGTANVLLYAPAWLQILHLALALSLWVCTVLLWATVLVAREGSVTPAPPEIP